MKFILAMAIVLLSLGAQADIKQLDAVMAKATESEKKDLSKLLRQINLVRTKEVHGSSSTMKVVKVEKGSVYDREGIKVGDLVQVGTANDSGKKMEIQQKMKPAAETKTK